MACIEFSISRYITVASLVSWNLELHNIMMYFKLLLKHVRSSEQSRSSTESTACIQCTTFIKILRNQLLKTPIHSRTDKRTGCFVYLQLLLRGMITRTTYMLPVTNGQTSSYVHVLQVFESSLLHAMPDFGNNLDSRSETQYMCNSNMTWFFSPIESTDTNCALLAHKAALFHSRESPFRESVLLSVFLVPWVKLGHY